jgi:hypothetical protein
MADLQTSKQVKILSLTLRILLLSGLVTQKDLVRAARIAAAEVRRQSPSLPNRATKPDTEVLMAPYETQLA